MPASLFGTFFAVYHNDVGRKVNVAVKQAAANRISVNRSAGCFKFADACRVKAAGNDNFYIIKAFGIKRAAHVPYQLLAYAGGVKHAKLAKQAFVYHCSAGIKAYACKISAKFAGNGNGGVHAVVVKIYQCNAGNFRVNIFVKGFGCGNGIAVVGGN